MTPLRRAHELAADWNARFQGAPALDVLRAAYAEFGREITLASSFGPEDTALIDLACQATDRPRVFFLDTGRLHEETYEILNSVRDRYGLNIELFFPESSAVESLVRKKGPFSFYESIENRRECCGIRKVEPLGRALAGARAWITGLRREQSVTRTDVELVEVDETHNHILKLNPLVDWTYEDVVSYHEERRIPMHSLVGKGYPSIGCAPCTRAIQPGEDQRAGRWWWEADDSKECGLHVDESGQITRASGKANS